MLKGERTASRTGSAAGSVLHRAARGYALRNCQKVWNQRIRHPEAERISDQKCEPDPGGMEDPGEITRWLAGTCLWVFASPIFFCLFHFRFLSESSVYLCRRELFRTVQNHTRMVRIYLQRNSVFLCSNKREMSCEE